MLENIIKERILILDGATGTLAGSYGITTGDTDSLNLSRPDVVRAIHRRYLSAGADIITTNTFSSQRISQAGYGLAGRCRELALTGARIARECADEFASANHPRYVAGSIGPTNKTASLSPNVDDAAARDITYDELYEAYREETDALIDGGVDCFLIETVFDTLNCKAALAAAFGSMEAKGRKLPVMISVTVSDKSGRTLSGQTLEAFLASLSSFDIFSVGLNCGVGARQMTPFLKALAGRAPYYISAYPNAGLPDETGRYTESAEEMCPVVESWISAGLVNIIGGCCGTDDEVIRRFALLAEGKPPRVPRPRYRLLHLSGLSELVPRGESGFTNIGERCNVAGSRRFLRLISERNYDEAISIARRQVADGAMILDINMDNGLLDAKAEMVRFVCLLGGEPDIARVPFMVDSSDWDVIEAALGCIQGKCIVNSISLKEGRESFIRHALTIKRFGVAVVVMLFDEEGQAVTYERKIEIAARAYRILTEEAGINPVDIIFDPNILSIATGIEEHDAYAADFIRAARWIRANCPGAHVSGGVSNLSFAFRGNDYIREAMHAVFLYHAVRAGMDFGIVNPATRVTYADIPPKLLSLLEDVVLNRRQGAAEELIEEAVRIKEERSGTEDKVVIKTDAWRSGSLEERLRYALRAGIGEWLAEDLKEALAAYPRAVDIIEGPLMAGMNEVGRLFGEGKMFLPQVVKTARTMKQAVSILRPYIEEQKSGGGATAGRVVLATVKGDVHDIGKNIVAVVMACNNFAVTDLGVMVPAETIIDTAKRGRADIVCLSGLITPSLEEMAAVVRELESAGMDIPVIVGGATTSELHTALKLAPLYRGIVIRSRDAAENAVIATRLMNPKERNALAGELRARYAELRASYKEKQTRIVSIEEARRNRPNYFD
ncbi:MAG: methionine synthase [Prevotella sp.]|nr:methionine synthase [Prevotella sp.]